MGILQGTAETENNSLLPKLSASQENELSEIDSNKVAPLLK
jgi:hypothetical protein